MFFYTLQMYRVDKNLYFSKIYETRRLGALI